MAQVHRFRDKVAIHVGNGSTVYLTQKEARALANALQACQRDISLTRYVDSELRTVDIAISAPDCARLKIDREQESGQ